MRLIGRLQSTFRTAISRNNPQPQARYLLSRSHSLTTSPKMDAAPSEAKTEINSAKQSESQPPAAPLALPAADGSTPTLEVGGSALRLDHLGPLVVNADGTLSRVANWDTMADIERENALRILGKRNQMRLAKLRAAKSESEKSDNSPQQTD